MTLYTRRALILAILARAVGMSETTGVGFFSTLIESCTLAACTSVPSPNAPNSSLDILYGAVAVSSNDVWAVGYAAYENQPHDVPLILHYDGRSWTLDTHSQQNCNSNADIILNKVDAYASNDVWAVGSYQLNYYVQPLIEHFDGNQWTCTALTPPGGSYGVFNSVFVGNEHNLWAVGKYYGSNSINNLIEHWHGSALTDTDASTWDVVSETNVAANNVLLGVSAPGLAGESPGGKIIITSTYGVGYSSDSNDQNNQTLVEGIAAPVPPSYTTSLYVTTINTQTHFNKGYCAAKSGIGGLIILDYGQPYTYSVSPLIYGTKIFDQIFTPVTTSAIATAVMSFTDGYNAAYKGNPGPICGSSSSSSPKSAEIALGTNNEINISGTVGAVNYNHGSSWAGLVHQIQLYVSGQHYYEIGIAAADDIEPGFGDFSHTLDWIEGYNDAGVSYVYNFGATEQYPCEYASMPLPNSLSCARDIFNTVWTADQFYTISWGIAKTDVIPEIYHNSDSLYWYQIGNWGFKNYAKTMNFEGAITQCGSSGGCADPSANYKPIEGWQALWQALNISYRTEQSTYFMSWSTDIACMTLPSPACQLNKLNVY